MVGDARFRGTVLCRLILISTLILVGCSDGKVSKAEDSDRLLEAVLTARAENGLSLHCKLLRDTVDTGDPVELIYFVVNGGEARPFLNDLQQYYFEVETSDGTRVSAVSHGSASVTRNPSAVLTLPSGIMFGQVVDLYCVRSPYMLSAYAEGECEYGYRFDEPGQYRIVTSWGQPDPFLEISDTVWLVVRE